MTVGLDSPLKAPGNTWKAAQQPAELRELLARLATRRWVWLLALTFMLMAIAAFGWRGGAHEPAYTTAAVGREDIEETVTALGNLQPRDYVDVGAQATGQLRKLHVDIGSSVKRGQLLAEIDPQVASAKVEQD